MANSLTTSYAGEFAGDYVAAALLSSPTLEKGLVTVLPNIHYKRVMKKLGTTGGALVDATCDFDHNMDINITERLLTLTELQSNVQLCKKDYQQDWIATQAGYSAYEALPKSFADFVIGHVAGMVAAKNETNIWEGDNGNSGEFDGFVTLALADATVIDVASHAAITASNVIDKLGACVDAVPATLFGSESLKIYASQNIIKAYVRALGGFATGGQGAAGTDSKGTQWFNGQELYFDGIPVVLANGLSSDTAMVAESTNLFYGCGLMSDLNETKFLDMSDVDGSQNCRVIMRMQAGVQYAIGSEIVLYHA